MTWFFTPEPRPNAGVRLFCLPYAGGSAAVFREWGAAFREGIEVRGVQLPGRGWRLREPAESDLKGLARRLASAILDCSDRPFALFGHSMGSWMALEVARALQARGASPLALFASGRQAPSLGSTRPPLGHLDDEAFVRRVQEQYGGIPRAILDDREILDLLLPALRADITGLERYRHDAAPRLACPVSALGGQDDPVVPVGQLAPWKEVTTGSFEVRPFPGGHFYFQPDPGALVAFLAERIELAATSNALSDVRIAPAAAAGGPGP